MTGSRKRYIVPAFPDGEFNLIGFSASGTNMMVGPFSKERMSRSDDGTIELSDGMGSHPTVLRVRSQDRNVLHANDGDVNENQDWAIVPDESQ